MLCETCACRVAVWPHLLFLGCRCTRSTAWRCSRFSVSWLTCTSYGPVLFAHYSNSCSVILGFAAAVRGSGCFAPRWSNYKSHFLFWWAAWDWGVHRLNSRLPLLSGFKWSALGWCRFVFRSNTMSENIFDGPACFGGANFNCVAIIFRENEKKFSGNLLLLWVMYFLFFLIIHYNYCISSESI